MSTINLLSVTTIRDEGLGTSEGIVGWAAKATAYAAIDLQETWTSMLRNTDREETAKWLAAQRWRDSEKAKARGSLLHKYFEAVAKGTDPPAISEEEAPYVKQFHLWLERFQPEFVMAEAPVYNVTHNYAGTLDGIMALAGLDRIIDYKTHTKPPDARSRPPYPEVALQLAAYRHAELVGIGTPPPREDKFRRRYYPFDPDLEYEPMPKVDAAVCIAVSPYDCIAHPILADDEIFEAFLYCRDNAFWRLQLQGGVIGEPLRPPVREEAYVGRS